MKKLLKAFTLAEILITLGIVGVIARVTLPSLNSNVSNRKIEASLSKAINTLTTVNSQILAEEGARSLFKALNPEEESLEETSTVNPDGTYNKQSQESDSKIRLFSDAYIKGIAPYVKGTLKTETVKDEKGNDAEIVTLTMDDGIKFMQHQSSDNGSKIGTLTGGSKFSELMPGYKGHAFFVTIDINGSSKPNKVGSDKFTVLIDDYGAVMPEGGYNFTKYLEACLGNAMTSSKKAYWESTCNNTKCTRPSYAAGSIVDNGYKVIYKL